MKRKTKATPSVAPLRRHVVSFEVESRQLTKMDLEAIDYGEMISEATGQIAVLTEAPKANAIRARGR